MTPLPHGPRRSPERGHVTRPVLQEGNPGRQTAPQRGKAADLHGGRGLSLP